MNQYKPSLAPAALIGGVFLGVTSALPVINCANCACCLLVIGGGVLASFIYLRDYPADLPAMTYGDGAVLGLITGAIGALVWTAVEISLTYFKVSLMNINDMERLEEILNDPDIPPWVDEVVALMSTSDALNLGVIFATFFIYLIIAVLFASLGGVIGVALFQSSRPAAPAAPAGPPTTPPHVPQG